MLNWRIRDHLMDDQTQSPIPSNSPDLSDNIANDAMALLNPSDAWFSFHGRSHGPEFSQSNLVSDSQAGHLNASIQDPNLINPWGVAFSPTEPYLGQQQPHRHRDGLQYRSEDERNHGGPARWSPSRRLKPYPG